MGGRCSSGTSRSRTEIEVEPRDSVPLPAAGMAQLAEYDSEQLELLTDFLRRGEELQRTQSERIRGSEGDWKVS